MGRLFRRMGLPFWTFVGIGISAIWFQVLGSLAERLFARILGWPVSGSEWGPPSLVLLSSLVVMFLLWLWQRLGRRIAVGTRRGPFAQPEGKRALILLVSRAEHALRAIEYHHGKGKLEQVWLLYTAGKEQAQFGAGSFAEVERIERQCWERCAGKVDVHRFCEVSPAEAQDTFEAVNRIYRTSGLDTRDIIADFTGGTKPMTVGMIMACLRRGRELEYIALHPQTREMHGPYLVDYQSSAFDLVG